ncbi:MAG: hypothetical protein IT405_00050 [Candidatus Yanofskybacteria bacterium]|nr:hypothetical protein [Candidatus Yanofskybacteria bacterium]
MTLIETILVLLIVLNIATSDFVSWLVRAAGLWLFPLTRIQRVIRPNPACPVCHGEGAYLHPLGTVVDCALGCNVGKPQCVVSPLFLAHINELGLRLGLKEKDSRDFAHGVCDQANLRLGPPIPAFTRTEHGWEYSADGKQTAP